MVIFDSYVKLPEGNDINSSLPMFSGEIYLNLPHPRLHQLPIFSSWLLHTPQLWRVHLAPAGLLSTPSSVSWAARAEAARAEVERFPRGIPICIYIYINILCIYIYILCIYICIYLYINI